MQKIHTSMTTHRRALLSLGLALSAFAFGVKAQPLSDRPIKIVVGAPAGGTADIIARLVGNALSTNLGQPVVVDNKPGAGGAIAMDAMLSAPKDGHTYLLSVNALVTELPYSIKPKYDPFKDLVPLVEIVNSPLVLIANAALPVSNLKDMAAYVKTQPAKTSFASYSAGTSSHYAGMILNQKAGLDLLHVPFAGSPPALAQVMGGQISIMFDGMATSLPQVKGGKLQIYGVASKTRSTHLPQVPTLAEEGLQDIEFGNWLGVVVSSGVANDITDKINAAVVKAAEANKVKTRLVGAGFEANVALTSAQLQQSVLAEYERNAMIVKNFKIQLNP